MGEIGVAEQIEGRDRDRLKGNGETESFERPELAGNRQKIQNLMFFLLFPEKNITKNIPSHRPY